MIKQTKEGMVKFDGIISKLLWCFVLGFCIISFLGMLKEGVRALQYGDLPRVLPSDWLWHQGN